MYIFKCVGMDVCACNYVFCVCIGVCMNVNRPMYKYMLYRCIKVTFLNFSITFSENNCSL
jgi:hypothetical protein